MRRLRVIAAVLGAVVLLVGIGYVGWRSQYTATGDVLSVAGSRDSRTLVVTHASCGQEGRLSVSESATRVRINIKLDHPVRGECDAPATVTTVELDAVLGDREVTGGSRPDAMLVEGRDR